MFFWNECDENLLIPPIQEGSLQLRVILFKSNIVNCYSQVQKLHSMRIGLWGEEILTCFSVR
jgi:hypothetical protein